MDKILVEEFEVSVVAHIINDILVDIAQDFVERSVVAFFLIFVVLSSSSHRMYRPYATARMDILIGSGRIHCWPLLGES